MEEKLWTREELADFLRVDKRTVDKLRKEGMPSLKVGTQVRFDPKAVKEWLRK